MPVPTGSSDFLKKKLKITNVCFVRHGSAPRNQELRWFPGGAALCRGWRGAPGTSPLAAVPSVPPSGPLPRDPRPPSAQKPRVPPAKPRPSGARERGERRCGTSTQLGTGATGQAGLVPPAEGSPEGAERGPGPVAPAGWPGDSPERGPGTERRRPKRCSRLAPVPRGRFGSTEREIPEAGGRAPLGSLHPASPAGSSRPGDAGGRLRYNSP